MLEISIEQVLRVRLFGPELRISVAGLPMTSSAAPKTKELLAYLVINGREATSRDGIAAELWPDVIDSEARKNLRRHLSLLQRYLASCSESVHIVLDGDTLRWEAGSAWVDVYLFERLARTPGAASAAVDLYGGDLLFRVDAAWLERERQRLRADALDLLAKLTDVAERFGDLRKAARYAAETLRIDPFREEAVRRMMNYALRNGDRAAAMRIFREFEQRLAAELDVAPMTETRELCRLIETSHALPPAPTFAENDDFVGRSEELARIVQHLGLSRLVTVIGAGGMGKSRVAARLVRDLGPHFGDGTKVVKLDAISPGSSLLSVMISEFDLVQGPDDVMLRAILSFLGPKQLLLVLDGCEQHAGDARRVVAAILEHCPNVRVLATSREPLRGPQERTFQLPPLSTPAQAADDRAGVLDSEAAQLFLQRARAAAPVADLGPRDVTALREICTRLDGIPLAIEIAAARCRVLSISEIAKRLDDSALVLDYARTGVATHQRTMRDIIAWAYDSLAPDHRSGLQALSLFRTAVTLEDIESLTDGLLQCSPIDFVTSLVECSLLLVEYGNVAVRYRLLEPIRDFAMEQVAGQDAAIALTRRHVDFHASNARRLALPEGGAEPGPAFDRLEAQRRNVYATLERVVTLEIVDTASVELALAMTLFWKERGYVQEGYSILARFAEAVAQGEDAAPGSQQVLIEASSFARLAGEYSRSREYAARAQAFAEKGGDRRGRGSALFELAAIEYSVGNLESARLQFEESYREFDSLGDQPGAARAQVDVALIELQQGHYDAAFAMLDAAIKALATSERRRWHMFAVSALGFTERFRGNYVQARQHSSAALRFAREIGDRALFNTCLANLGSVALAVKDDITLLSAVREGLKSTRSGSFPFSMVHYLEVACRYLLVSERHAECARLSAMLGVLLERFEIVPPVEDFETIEHRWDFLRAKLDADIIEALHERARAASTEDCIDAALDAIDG